MSRLGTEHAVNRKAAKRPAEYLEGLARGLSVISAFNKDSPKMTLAAAGKTLGLPRATVRRALITLEILGYVETDGRLFWLTPKVLELAGAYLLSNMLSTLFQPLCDKLASELDTGISVAVLHQDEIVFIVRSYPNHLFSGDRGIVGSRLPAFSTALGRVLLTGLSDSELSDYMKRLVPKDMTTFTKTKKKDIREEIELARKRGYAFASQEANIGFRSVAVSLRRFDGKTVAALSASGRVELISEKVMRSTMLPRLLEERDKIKLPSSG
jgi:IclR family pca regulon transcriptional regulator